MEGEGGGRRGGKEGKGEKREVGGKRWGEKGGKEGGGRIGTYDPGNIRRCIRGRVLLRDGKHQGGRPEDRRRDRFEIQTVKDYPADYYACIEEAKAELRADARPELKASPESLDAYDTVFLGYPNWWGTCPMCVLTFLERFDLAGKRIIPFCTNEGSGMGVSEKRLKEVCTGAKVESGLSVIGNQAAGSRDRVMAWARKMV